MPKTLYVHVGAGKTGTSALQSFFLLNEEALGDVGVGLPVQGRMKANAGLMHHKLSNHGPHQNDNVLQDWKDLGAEDLETAIVSSEYFHNKISAPGGEAFFTTIRDTLTCDIRIVFYIRRQSQWLQSAYAQWVKSSSEVRSFATFVEQYRRNLPDQILAFSKIFGPEAMIVRPYEKAQFFEGEICHDFCHAAGVAWREDFQLPQSNPNPRLSLDALELKRRLNAVIDDPAKLTQLRGILLEYSANADSEGSHSVFHTHGLLDPATQLRIEERSATNYRIIAETLMNRSDGLLFHDGLEDRLRSMPESASAEPEIDLEHVTAFVGARLPWAIDALNGRESAQFK